MIQMKNRYSFLRLTVWKSMFSGFLILGLFFLLDSCIDDKGNYDYTAPETPEVTIDSIYYVNLGEQLIVEPKVLFSDKSRLSFHWTIPDPNLMREHEYDGEKLDIVFALRAQQYNGRLTVTDSHLGMKYFYHFIIQGQSSFSDGIVVLSSDSGQAKLSFVKRDGTIQGDLYELMNNGASLPRDPLQIVSLVNTGYAGGIYLGYWLICADKNDPGVQVDVNTLVKIKHFKENFFTIPEGEVDAGRFIPLDNGTMVGIANQKFYAGRFEGYYEWPGYGFFSPPIPGDYLLAPCLEPDAGRSFYWSYNLKKGALICFIPPAGMLFNSEHIQGPPMQWDPTNVGLESDITLLLGGTGTFYLFGRDAAGTMQELAFMSAGQNVISQYKREFAHASLIRSTTKWASYLTEIYFSSGNKVYGYNPNSQQLSELTAANLQGDVTLLKVGSAGQLIVGTEGRLYWLNINPGQNGSVIETISGFDGAPVDIYDRRR